tara:strand:- start:337 stop:510 length:174 start_codon:yes stop_codon:yes gene_type:complete
MKKSEEEMENEFQERERRKAFKEECSALRYDTRVYGIKFWDERGSGRIVKGKKIYKS